MSTSTSICTGQASASAFSYIMSSTMSDEVALTTAYDCCNKLRQHAQGEITFVHCSCTLTSMLADHNGQYTCCDTGGHHDLSAEQSVELLTIA